MNAPSRSAAIVESGPATATKEAARPLRPGVVGREVEIDCANGHSDLHLRGIDIAQFTKHPHPFLELHERDGSAWLGVTPFWVGGLRSRGTPPLPWLSRFSELNVRTYVTYGGRPGIHFFSLDAARLAAVIAARRAYRLPYFHAQMTARREGAWVEYASRRVDSSGPAAGFRASYGPAGPRLPVEDRSLERWLSERYCLYIVDGQGRALRGDIHHPPRPLQPARATIELNTMAAPLHIDLKTEPLLHYSPRQDVLIWALEAA